MKNIKRKLSIAGVTLLSVMTLAACSQDKVIVKMKGGEITQTELFNNVKTNSTVQASLMNSIITIALEDKYGDKISNDDVTKEYNKVIETYGSEETLKTALKDAGLTVKTFKEQLKANLLLDYTVRNEAKKNITPSDYEAAYANYTPEMTIQVVKTTTEDEAKTVKEQIENGTTISSLVEKYETDANADQITGEMKFDSTSTEVSTDIMNASIKLEKDNVSDIITVVDTSSFETSYYVIKMINKETKDEDWKVYEEKLTNIIVESRVNDSNFTTTVLSQVLKDYDVEVKDSSFKTYVEEYLNYSDLTNQSSTSNSSSSEEK